MAIKKIFNLNRFIFSQKQYFDKALEEIKSKNKSSHWIWFIFPQLKGLGKSFISDYYGISGIEEAGEYYKIPYLKNNLDKCVKSLSCYKNSDEIINAFGETDTKKIKSCMTLFFLTTNKKSFKIVLDKFFNGKLDENTVNLLRGN